MNIQTVHRRFHQPTRSFAIWTPIVLCAFALSIGCGSNPLDPEVSDVEISGAPTGLSTGSVVQASKLLEGGDASAGEDSFDYDDGTGQMPHLGTVSISLQGPWDLGGGIRSTTSDP